MTCLKTSVFLLAIPRFLRVRELKINQKGYDRQFVICSCCERTKIGVPCPCFFKIARDAKIPFQTIMDVGMFDVRYTKLFNSHYACNDQTMDYEEFLKIGTRAIQ